MQDIISLIAGFFPRYVDDLATLMQDFVDTTFMQYLSAPIEDLTPYAQDHTTFYSGYGREVMLFSDLFLQ